MTEKKEDTLVTLTKKIETIIIKHLDLETTPGIILMFTEPPKYDKVRYIMNVGLEGGLDMIKKASKEIPIRIDQEQKDD